MSKYNGKSRKMYKMFITTRHYRRIPNTKNTKSEYNTVGVPSDICTIYAANIRASTYIEE